MLVFKPKRINLLFAAFVLLFSSCDSMAQVKDKAFSTMLYTLLDHSVAEISVVEFQSKKDSFLILDAREKEEYEISHIQNAKWVGYKSFDPKKIEEFDRTRPLVVYCSVGYRSEKIAEKLLELGFHNVQNLYGGIFEWANKDFPLYKNDTSTNKIHAYDKKWGIWLNDYYEKVY